METCLSLWILAVRGIKPFKSVLPYLILTGHFSAFKVTFYFALSASTVYLKMPNTVHIYSEYVTYSELQFTSDLGGFLGLFMGLSLYSLHDFMNIVIDWGIDVISA